MGMLMTCPSVVSVKIKPNTGPLLLCVHCRPLLNLVFPITENMRIKDKSVDVILGLKLVHNVTERASIIFSCYLPLEGFIHGRNAQEFYAHLLTQIYMHSECDYMFIGADFNARLGSVRCQSSQQTNTMSPLGMCWTGNLPSIEFLNDSNFCVLHCRFGRDNYTSISSRGNAVVDYICVPLHTFSAIKYCKVMTMQGIGG